MTLVKTLLQESCQVKQKMLDDAQLLRDIQVVADLCIQTISQGNKLLLAGNGGSASDAQHIAAELVGRFEKDRQGLPALALTTNISQMTAISNDYGFDNLFLRQLEALANKDDLFIALSTSGHSSNVLAAAQACSSLGVKSIGLTGQSGGKLASVVDLCLRMPSNNTARIQEAHITVGHIICASIEYALFESKS